MRKITHLPLRGQKWSMKWADKIKTDATDEEVRGLAEKHVSKISIRQDLKGVDLLDTLVHEMLHGCLWDLDEQAVLETASSIATALHRIGYRLPDAGGA